MFRLWVMEWKDGRLIRDTVVENADRDTRTHKVLHGLEEGCRRFDLPVPIWLDSSIRDFQSYAANCVTDTAGACRLLQCSRQNISDLVKRGKLHPLHASAAGTLFLLSEIRQRLWQ